MSSLSLIQQQKLQQKLSPAQIQVVKMLELPSCELGQRINEELQDNPALEESPGTLSESVNETDNDLSSEEDNRYEDEYTNPLQNDDFNYDDYIQDDETPDYTPSYSGVSEDNRDIPFSVGISFGEYLKSQIYLTKMDKPQRHIAKFIVGNIDEDGYMRRSVEELVDDLSFREGIIVGEDEMELILDQIKRFDPPGVGARNLQECLLIQLSQKPNSESVHLAQRILEHYFDDFSKRHFSKICQQMSISEEQMHQAVNEITRLNPKPGSAWSGTVYDRHQTSVIPDFIVEHHNGELVISLNNGDIPQLRVSEQYNQMLQDYSQNPANQTTQKKEAIRFVKSKIDSARWFIDAIRQRNETLMRTMQAITQEQKAFFEEGDETNLKPMILSDIAQKTGYDISTISRVSNSKYVQTEYGIYPLKFFFSEGMKNIEGEDISTREIKKGLLELINAEDKKSPLTDEQLVDRMKGNGYAIARRTIAKYRDQLNIPVARLRREV